MKKLKNEIENIVNSEYNRAAEKFGECNNSSHESFAVILEEVQEAGIEIKSFKQALDIFWTVVKDNKKAYSLKTQTDKLTEMKSHAINIACEFVQVAAMCEKALITIDRKYKK